MINTDYFFSTQEAIRVANIGALKFNSGTNDESSIVLDPTADND
jgi:hypothetical protein